MSKQIELVKKYLDSVEKLELNTEILHEDYLQWELPNLLNRSGQKSDLKDSVKRLAAAKNILSSQEYQITSTLEQKNTVVMEAKWTGKMAIHAGALKAGQELKAYFCMIFEFKDEKIHRIRNYDCFENFEAN